MSKAGESRVRRQPGVLPILHRKTYLKYTHTDREGGATHNFKLIGSTDLDNITEGRHCKR